MRVIGENLLIIFGTAAFGIVVFCGAIELLDDLMGRWLRYHNKQAQILQGVVLYKGRKW